MEENTLNISVNLSKVVGAFNAPIQGRVEKKDCICIAKDQLSVDRNGNVWLNITAYPSDKFEGQTHTLKQKLSKAQYDALPSDGNGKKRSEYIGKIKVDAPKPSYSTDNANDSEPGDLPF